MKKKIKPAAPQEHRPAEKEKTDKIEFVDVSSVEMFDAACKETIICEVPFHGKIWRIPGRLLTPAERDQVDMILEQALPDLLPPAQPGGEARYDLRSPSYLAAKAKFKAQARALALYLAYPMFGQNEKVKAAVSPKVNIGLLADVMQSLFISDIQDLMWYRVIGQSRLWDRANFF